MAVITTAVIAGVGVAGSLAQGAKASSAAKKAAAGQSAAATASLGETQRQFDITQAGLQPFQSAGEAALKEQRALLGLAEFQPQVQPQPQPQPQLQPQLRPQPQFQPPVNEGGFRFVIPDVQAAQSQSAGDKARFRFAIPDAQAAQQQPQQPVSGQAPQPVSEQELQAFRVQAQQDALSRIETSPGQKFLRDRAQRNLLRNVSAIGGLGGGNVRSALVQQGVGFAQQDIQNRFGRLGQLAGQGQAAVTSIGQFGAQSVGQQGQQRQLAAEARASGILGAAQIRAQTFNQAVSGIGQIVGQFQTPAAPQAI